MVKCFIRLWEFVVLRVILYFIVALLFLISSVFLQDWLISFLGATPFNYLITTLVAALVCFSLVYFVNQFMITVVDVLQLCSLSRIELLMQNKSLSSISVGWNVLKRYFAHIGLLLSLKFIIKKVISESGDNIESSIKDSDVFSPFVDLLESPIAVFIKKAVFGYAFECCTYYILTNTKPEKVSSMLNSVDDLVRTYIKSIPSLLKAAICALLVVDIPMKVIPIIVSILVGLSSSSIIELLWRVALTLIICNLCDIIVLRPFVTASMVFGFADVDLSESDTIETTDTDLTSTPSDDIDDINIHSGQPFANEVGLNGRQVVQGSALPFVADNTEPTNVSSTSADNSQSQSDNLPPVFATDAEIQNVISKIGNNLPSMSSIFNAFGTDSAHGSVERLATAFTESQRENTSDDLVFSGF